MHYLKMLLTHFIDYRLTCDDLTTEALSYISSPGPFPDMVSGPVCVDDPESYDSVRFWLLFGTPKLDWSMERSHTKTDQGKTDQGCGNPGKNLKSWNHSYSTAKRNLTHHNIYTISYTNYDGRQVADN